ncbi:MAG: DNA mismatch repair endonuclease MutL [Acetatifactor sp.]
MARIHVLDSETIDKIAAGEVVERPASVVKELVENAIDANATALTVEIKDGGIELIRVTDNGCGMEKEQLRTAFLRHATSKIETSDDLSRLSSLGFRGEALSSIAAVSKVEVITKPAGSITGTRILLEGAKEISFEEIGAPEGTTFLMRNLFFNTPVRRKFLKQPATEGSYIADLMEHLALSRPDISFKLVIGGQLKFHTSGNGDLREVIYRIYGRDVAAALIPMQWEQEGIRVEGYLGTPVQVRSTRNYEIYFINGRFVRSNVIARAIEEGYKEYLMQHKFPFCVLHINMDSARVDVNVHPTKMDIRFTNPMAFGAYLCGAVKYTLKHHEMIPRASLSTEREQKAESKAEEKAAVREQVPEPFEVNRRGENGRTLNCIREETKYETEGQRSREIARNPVWERVKSTGDTFEGKEDFFSETSEIAEPVREKTERAEGLPEKEGLNDRKECRSQGKDNIGVSGVTGIIGETGMPGEQMNLFEEKILTAENRAHFRIIGQVFETYWLVEFQDKLLMIDQHAAHEKVNYERLMKQYREKRVLSQSLMPPIVISLSAQEEAVLAENREVFEGLGFEVESFGGNEYTLRSVPLDLYGCGEREMFLEVLDQLAEGGNYGSIRVIEEKIASMSCKAAVKGNNLLKQAEAETLIDELLTLENPYNCPHGRPTIVEMSKADMERKFKRIVT